MLLLASLSQTQRYHSAFTSGLATVQSKKQPLETKFDLETLISALWKGRVKQVVASMGFLLLTDLVERMKWFWSVLSGPCKREHVSAEGNRLWHSTRTLSSKLICVRSLMLCHGLLALALFAVFASFISGVLSLLHCRVSTVVKVVTPLPGDSDQGKQWLWCSSHF